MSFEEQRGSNVKQPSVKDNPEYIRLYGYNLRRITDQENKIMANLSWLIRDNYPRISVMPNTKEYNVEDMITAPFDYITLYTALDIFLDMVKEGKESTFKVENKNIKYITDEMGNRVKTNEKYIQAHVTFGITANQIAYIAVSKDGQPPIKFPILVDKEWFTFYKHDSEELKDNRVISLKYAEVYIKSLKNTLDYFLRQISVNKQEEKTAATTKVTPNTYYKNNYNKSNYNKSNNNYNKSGYNNVNYKIYQNQNTNQPQQVQQVQQPTQVVQQAQESTPVTQPVQNTQPTQPLEQPTVQNTPTVNDVPAEIEDLLQ